MKKRLLAFLAMAGIISCFATPAFATETVKINGYPNHTVGEDEVTAEFQVSISNVERKESHLHPSLGEVYVCQAPVAVTSIDELSGFGVSTFIPTMDTYTEGEYLLPDGQTEHWFDEMRESIPAGTKFTLTDPGLYYVYGNYGALEGGVNAVILVESSASAVQTAPSANTAAAPTASKVIAGGNEIEVDAYTINNNNYFKLRDVAAIVKESARQFEVSWNSEKRSIELISGKPYTYVGGELAKGDGTAKEAALNTAAIYKDGAPISLTAYTINGNNYFKLRDLGETFNFGVSWDGVNNAVLIKPFEPYTAD